MASTGHFNFQPIGRHRHCTVSTNAPSLPGLPRNGGGAFSCPNRERTLLAVAVQVGVARRPARLLQAQSGLWKALRLRFFLLTCADADGQLDINAAGLWARLPAKLKRRATTIPARNQTSHADTSQRTCHRRDCAIYSPVEAGGYANELRVTV